ncbi:serine protease inhibitor Kazal-type 14 [Talpa occidentalis]|uniref:serine protease inhibitor Kazal-type 14 n=1 Tax=Talpa occidentalis TaxID=50954 RepID=UPI00188E3E90|nr:serine protease inhibitor Kazal-type 14 [Talpa occidentalis]XP_054550608.1 serine protease inhibitor Kazal-type 14 [Talpa occidentalis]
MARSFPVFCSLLFFISLTLPAVSKLQEWWPPKGKIKLKCPYKRVDLSWYRSTVNPCPGLYQPICGTNFMTYDNPCILCIESMKSRGKIRFQHDGKC